MRQFKPGQLQTGSLYNISASYAVTASFALNGGGGGGTTINTGSFVTTSSFNAFTSSYATGSFTGSFVGTLLGTSSWASNSVTASYYAGTVTTASYAVTASYVLNAVSSSYATTASYAINAVSASYAPSTPAFPYTGSARITGSLGITGSFSVLATTSSAANIFTVRDSADTFNIVETRGDVTTVFRRSNNTENTLTIDGTNNYIDLFRPDGAAHRGIRLFKSSSNLNSLEYYTQNSSVNGHFLFKSQPANASGYGTSAPAFVFDIGTTGVTFTAANPGRIHLGNDTPTTLQTAGLGTYTFLIKNGTSPTTSSVDNFILYSADIAAGTASAHFRNEAGHVVKLYTQSPVTSSQGIADALTNLGFLTGSSIINPTASYAVSSSYALTSSFATSASYAPDTTFPYTGSARITGSLSITGSTISTQIGIGAAPNGSTPLDVRAQGALSSDTVFRVRNSADNQNLMSITGDGQIVIGLSASINLGGNSLPYESVVIGKGASAGLYATAIGAASIAEYYSSVAIGRATRAGIESVAIGYGATAYNAAIYPTLAIGYAAVASGINSAVISVGNPGITNTLASSFAFGINNGGNAQSLFFNRNTNIVLRSNTALTSATHFDANATNTITIHSGSVPTTTVSGSVQFYAATGSLTNNTRPHFCTGNGTTVWLGDESRLFNVTASRTIISSSQNTASGSSLTVYGSGSALPVFTVQGSQGELFSITDSLSGSLFSVNDISGLPILEVFSDNTTLIGNYLDPMLITTAKTVQTNSGSFVLYSLPTASYDTAFFEYSVRSGSNARAGTIMAIQSGSAVNFTETTTTDFGNTAAVAFTVIVTGSNMALTGSSTSGAWTTKCIVRGI